eukprot:EG_transcript_15416
MFRVAQTSCSAVEDAALQQCFGGPPEVQITQGPISLYRDRRVQAESSGRQLRNSLVAIVVPAYISVLELLQRLEPFAGLVKGCVRVLVDANHPFFCILDCSAQEVADAVQAAFHLKPFAPEYHEYVLVLFLDHLDVTPHPFSSAIRLEDSLQLPACLICLERLDTSISGQISTMCNHSSSCDCIHKSQCSVCHLINLGWVDSHCEECGDVMMIWGCLICGFRGCGRYGKQHALQHAKRTGHNFSIDLQSQRIWDYEGDCFVHRLIYNRAERQVEYLPDTHEGLPMGKELVDSKLDAKVEAITTEYTHMLTSQLEIQRQYFTDQINLTRKKHGEVLCKKKVDLEHLHTKQARERNALETARKGKAEKEAALTAVRNQTQDTLEKIQKLEEANK